MIRVAVASLASAAAICLAWTSGTAKVPKPARLQAGLCHPAEHPLFQCVLGTKQVAVCASDGPGTKFVQYRFGRPGKVELAYPSDPKSGIGTLKWASTGFSGGGGMQIHFVNADTQFVLYSNMVRTGFNGPNYPMDQLGLFAVRNGHLTYDGHCKSNVPLVGGKDGWIDEEATKSLLPQGEYIYGPDDFYEHWERETPIHR